jgi:hypothetical protein
MTGLVRASGLAAVLPVALHGGERNDRQAPECRIATRHLQGLISIHLRFDLYIGDSDADRRGPACWSEYSLGRPCLSHAVIKFEERAAVPTRCPFVHLQLYSVFTSFDNELIVNYRGARAPSMFPPNVENYKNAQKKRDEAFDLAR